MQEGQDYLSGMAAAANYAWVNRSSMTFLVRQAFAKQFGQEPDDLDMHVVYDVSHNIAKVWLSRMEYNAVAYFLLWWLSYCSDVGPTFFPATDLLYLGVPESTFCI